MEWGDNEIYLGIENPAARIHSCKQLVFNLERSETAETINLRPRMLQLSPDDIVENVNMDYLVCVVPSHMCSHNGKQLFPQNGMENFLAEQICRYASVRP
jgi:hypothetical protein